MHYLNNSLRVLRQSAETVYINNAHLQFVRWRKPKSLGTAKSKLFRVPQRPVIPKEEELELQRLYNNYRTTTNSITNYLTLKYNVKYQASEDPEQVRKVFEEDFQRCMSINDKWNEEQKVLREQRVAKEIEEQLEFAKNRIQLEIEKEIETQEQIEAIVRKQKEESVHFITPEKLDAAIEHALANPVDYNFAIDINGNKIVGRETKPENVKVENVNS